MPKTGRVPQASRPHYRRDSRKRLNQERLELLPLRPGRKPGPAIQDAYCPATLQPSSSWSNEGNLSEPANNAAMSEHPDLILVDADGLPHVINDDSIAVLLITRDEIERGTVGDVVDRLMVMSDTPHAAQKLAGRVVIQVDGYNDDPRELMEIEDVREFFAAVHKQWRYWAHFMDSTLTESFNVIVGLLLQPKRQILGVRAVGVEYDNEEIETFLAEQFRCVYQLHQQHGLPDDHVQKRMMALLERLLGPSRPARELYEQIKGQAQVDF